MSAQNDEQQHPRVCIYEQHDTKLEAKLHFFSISFEVPWRWPCRCHDVGIADFPATATLLVSVRPCIITSKVKQQVMGSMDQRVPWNQFIREAKVGHSGSPTCDCCGIRRWTCYKKCTSALALSPQLLLVRRESAGVQECAGVILWTSLCRRNVSTFV